MTSCEPSPRALPAPGAPTPLRFAALFAGLCLCKFRPSVISAWGVPSSVARRPRQTKSRQNSSTNGRLFCCTVLADISSEREIDLMACGCMLIRLGRSRHLSPCLEPARLIGLSALAKGADGHLSLAHRVERDNPPAKLFRSWFHFSAF